MVARLIPERIPERILDAHIHFFDPRRPGGIPWPTPADGVLYQPALPERYSALVEPLGVGAAIAVEASPLRADNDWLLNVAASDGRIVGVVGNLDPAAEDFARELGRLCELARVLEQGRLRGRRLLVGLRSGNLWGRDLARDVADGRTLDHLRLVAEAGLTLDVANPDFALVGAVLRIAERVPELRIVVDHLPTMRVVEAERQRWCALLAEMGRSGNIFAKISEIPQRVGGRIPREAGFYQPKLEAIRASLGEDRLIFGSDWPNSDRWLNFDETLALVRECVAGWSESALRKFYRDNARRVYGLDG